MQIILLEDIRNLGKIGEVVKVKDGYGRNFLLKTGKLAIFFNFLIVACFNCSGTISIFVTRIIIGTFKNSNNPICSLVIFVIPIFAATKTKP